MEKKHFVWLCSGLGVILVSVLMYFVWESQQMTSVDYNTLMGNQLTPWNIKRGFETSEIIVVGKVISVETKLVDRSFTSTAEYEPGKRLHIERIIPYRYVTIATEHYLLDRSGNFADEITFRDAGEGVGIIDGKKTYIQQEQMVSYEKGERALFYISNLGGELGSFGFVRKFSFDNDGFVQSEFSKLQGDKPMKLIEHENQIKSFLGNESLVP